MISLTSWLQVDIEANAISRFRIQPKQTSGVAVEKNIAFYYQMCQDVSFERLSYVLVSS